MTKNTSEHKVLMVAHYQHTVDNICILSEDDALSEVCHQTSEHYNFQECQYVYIPTCYVYE